MADERNVSSDRIALATRSVPAIGPERTDAPEPLRDASEGPAPEPHGGARFGGPPSGDGDGRGGPSRANPTPYPVVFNGRAGEYFGIWIVNVSLTLLTLGIYSAWAKVRTKRYFYGNTSIAGESFDYHARPVTILIGRLIAVGVLIVLNIMTNIHWATSLVATLAYIVFLPWVIVRGYSFNANMTSYRTLRFHFEGRVRDALMAYFVWPFLSVLSLGALVPFGSRARARFLGGHRYGQARLRIDPPVRPFYRALGQTALVVLGAIAACAAVFGLSVALDAVGGDGLFTGVSALIFAVAFYPAIFVVPVWYRALSRNIVFGAMRLDGGHTFRSTVAPKRIVFIAVTNVLAILATLGLAYPWASIRMTRYLAANTTVLAASDLDEFAAAQRDETGAAQGELLDLDGGFDFGL